MSENLRAAPAGRPGNLIEGWTDTDDISLRYALSGQPGPTLVLLHELGGSLVSWDGLLAPLEPSFRVLRYDQRGHGLSEKIREPFTLDEQVDDLEAVLAALDASGPYWLVGVAAGAAIAVAFAARRPATVAGIVMCAPALHADPSRSHYLLSRSEMAAKLGMRAIADATLARSYPVEAIGDVAAYRAYRARFLANDPVSYGLANQALSSVALTDALAALRCPCLLLAGQHDLLRPPAMLQAQAAQLGNAEFQVLDCAHLMPVQAPAELSARIIDFVRRQS